MILYKETKERLVQSNSAFGYGEMLLFFEKRIVLRMNATLYRLI